MITPAGLLIPDNKTPEERFEELVRTRVDEELKRRMPFPPLEIQKTEDRYLAKKALSDLYKAMGLMGHGSGIVLPEDSIDRQKLHRTLWRTLGQTVLGKDCPGEWEYT